MHQLLFGHNGRPVAWIGSDDARALGATNIPDDLASAATDRIPARESRELLIALHPWLDQCALEPLADQLRPRSDHHPQSPLRHSTIRSPRQDMPGNWSVLAQPTRPSSRPPQNPARLVPDPCCPTPAQTQQHRTVPTRPVRAGRLRMRTLHRRD